MNCLDLRGHHPVWFVCLFGFFVRCFSKSNGDVSVQSKFLQLLFCLFYRKSFSTKFLKPQQQDILCLLSPLIEHLLELLPNTPCSRIILGSALGTTVGLRFILRQESCLGSSLEKKLKNHNLMKA